MRRLPALVVLALPALVWAADRSRLDPKAAEPPTAPVKPHTVTVHGDSLVDNYFWIREKSPETLGYIEAENAYTAAVFKPLEPLQEKLYKEILARIKQTDLSVPYQKRGF